GDLAEDARIPDLPTVLQAEFQLADRQDTVMAVSRIDAIGRGRPEEGGIDGGCELGFAAKEKGAPNATGNGQPAVADRPSGLQIDHRADTIEAVAGDHGGQRGRAPREEGEGIVLLVDMGKAQTAREQQVKTAYLDVLQGFEIPDLKLQFRRVVE